MTFQTDDLTNDAFLNGSIMIRQPKNGYRAGVDPVLLAAATAAKPGDGVLELGCGVGVASLCLAQRMPGIKLTAVELQPDYAAVAIENAATNGVDMAVHVADIRDLPKSVKSQNFDHVLMNPPYYQRTSGTGSTNPGRDIALAGDTPLSEWVETASRRLKPKGYLTAIQEVRRLPELLCAVDRCFGSIELLPLAARQNRAPHLMIIKARKGGRAAFRLHAPAIMHIGKKHDRDGDSYTPKFTAILRNGAALPFDQSEN